MFVVSMLLNTKSLLIATKQLVYFLQGCGVQDRSRKDSEVFGRSRIPKNTRNRNRCRSWIFLFDSDSVNPIESFCITLLKMGIPVEMVQFLLKLSLKQILFAVYHDFH